MSNWIPNSFQLPNALVDDKYLVELKGSALSMYILIVRKTRGWQKECDRISLSQFTEFTGYNKDAVLTEQEKHEILISSQAQLQRYAKSLNKLMHNLNITAPQRVLYVSGMLLSMQPVVDIHNTKN